MIIGRSTSIRLLLISSINIGFSTRRHVPQQKGIVERKNRHPLKVARSLCCTMQVLKKYWGDAFMAAAFLINQMPYRVSDYHTPLQMTSTFHLIHGLISLDPTVFVYVCYVHLHSIHREKLDPRVLKCVFLGYSSTLRGYKCFHPPMSKYYVSMDIEFQEHTSYFSQDVPNSLLQGEHPACEGVNLTHLEFSDYLKKDI